VVKPGVTHVASSCPRTGSEPNPVSRVVMAEDQRGRDPC